MVNMWCVTGRMLTILFSLLLFLVLSPVVAEEGDAKASSVSAGSADGDTIVVVARLVEIPGKFPPNDAYDYVYIMKYRIVKVEKGACTDKKILVGQYNPGVARNLIDDEMKDIIAGNVEKFTVGEKHHLTLVSPLEKYWDGAVETDYYDSELKTFFAIRTDVAP